LENELKLKQNTSDSIITRDDLLDKIAALQKELAGQQCNASETEI
jgi:hypothetical protein